MSGKTSYSESSKHDNEKTMQTTCKQMLETKVFKGSYQERRRMEELGGYRDLIVVSETDDFIDDLQYVKERISKFYADKKLWIGISSKDMIGAPAAGTCIWSELTTDLPFGQYSFIVKTLQFRDREVILEVMNVPAEVNTENSPSNEETRTEIDMEMLGDLFVSWKKAIAREIYQFLYYAITKENIIAFIKFMLFFAKSLLSNAIEFFKFFLPFSLRFIAEVRQLLAVSTPIIVQLIRLLEKIIGGLFIIVAMIWRDIFGRRPHSYDHYQIMDVPHDYRKNKRMYY